MFKWFLKTLISQINYQLKISWWERWENTKFIALILAIGIGFKKVKRERERVVNTFYNVWDIPAFSNTLKDAVLFNWKMARQILDPKHKGVRAWEYGLLLSCVSLKKGMKVLDVGSGGSAMPFYLSRKGLEITALDLDIPLEKPEQALLKLYPNVRYKQGDMRNLSFKNRSFDLVMCITAIEHLDYNFSTMKPNRYSSFLQDTKTALAEMVRVLKPGGRLFLTTDIYFPKLTTFDRYQQAFLYKNKIGAGFKREDFEKVFLDTLSRLGCSLIGKTDFDFEKIFSNTNRANFRGRYFTTFAIYAEK